MSRSGRRDALSPGEMFPRKDPAYRVSFARLESGIRIRVVERGDRKAPPVILVHGWGCSAYAFRFTMPALAAAGFRAIAFDLKGHGLSDKPHTSGEYTIERLVEHLRDVLDTLALEQPGDFLAIFVAAPGEIDHDDLIFAEFGRELGGLGDGMSRFQCRQNPLTARKQLKRLK